MANFHVMAGARGVRVQPTVRQIDYGDLAESLRLGFDDFWQKPSHYVFLCLIYPIVGVFLIQSSSGANAIHLAYPLMSGFALVGPFAAIGLYEISRRRDRKSTRLNSSHVKISYAVFCLKKKKE